VVDVVKDSIELLHGKVGNGNGELGIW
jgi:hypothetical protein